jgi:hypothetical protein
MHELVDLGHSMTHAAVGLCRDETRTSEHVGISPAEEGWTVANDNEMNLVAALTCNVLQQPAVTLWSSKMSLPTRNKSKDLKGIPALRNCTIFRFRKASRHTRYDAGDKN